MARTLSWGSQVYAIRDTVRNSQIETWVRKDIERLFGVKRVSAQNLMKAVGELDDVAGRHMVSRASLLSYLDMLIQAEDTELAHREHLQLAEPAPHRRVLKNTLPKDMESIMFRDLPLAIAIGRGRIEITGQNADAVIHNLLLLAKALENDLDSIRQVLDPPAMPMTSLDGELSAFMDDLRKKEEEYRRQVA